MARTTKRSRRASGTGSIYRDGDGYRAQVLIGYDPATGNAIVKKVRANSHAEAVEALAKLQHDSRQGKLVHGKSVSLDTFVTGWLEEKIKPLRAPKTYRQYKWVLTQHVIPTLGKKRLDQVARRDIQALIGALANQAAKPKAKDPEARAAKEAAKAKANGQTPPAAKPPKLLGRRTLQSAVTVLHSVYEDAIRDGLCAVNPCGYVELPREAKKPPQHLSRTEVDELNKALTDSPIRGIVRFMLATGTRLGEARGVRWQDLDLRSGVVRIAGQLQSIDGTLQYRPTTKTNQDRLLPIPQWLRTELQELKALQLIDGVQDPDGIVFLNPYGRRLHEKTVHSLLQKACKTAKVPVVSPHKLRHTAATLALMETGDLHAVQKMLGHQQVRLTSDLYGHATAERLRPLSDALGRIIGGKTA